MPWERHSRAFVSFFFLFYLFFFLSSLRVTVVTVHDPVRIYIYTFDWIIMESDEDSKKKKEKSAKKKIKYRRRRTFYRKRFLKIRFPVFFVPSFVISSSSFFFLTNQFIKDIIKLATINKLLRTNRFVISFFFLSFFALSEFANVRPRMDFTI